MKLLQLITAGTNLNCHHVIDLSTHYAFVLHNSKTFIRVALAF
jgi:hypothetical protein